MIRDLKTKMSINRTDIVAHRGAEFLRFWGKYDRPTGGQGGW